MRQKIAFYPLVFLAIVCISFAAILIRWAEEAPVLSIAAWRLTLSSLILLPLVIGRKREFALSRRNLALSFLSGGFLALHFIFWIASLRHTTVASSVVLVSASPIFVGLGSIAILKERLSRSLLWAILLSVFGAVLIGWGDVRVAGEALYGDILALLGALMAAGYFLIGRRVRQQTTLRNYIFITYSTAALCLIVASAIIGQQVIGFSRMTYVYLLLLALGPQLIGHTTFNWALKYLSASSVAVLTLGEPVLSALFAYLIFAEHITLLKTAGAGIILVSIYLSMRKEKVPNAQL